MVGSRTPPARAEAGDARRPPSTPRPGGIPLLAAISIGVGGMVGAGIFSILGVVAGVAGGGLPVSFAVGGVVALFAAYSYVKLGVRYPSAGGAVTYMVRGYGDGLRAGTANVFLYLSYVIAIALYAQGFAGYAVTFWHVPQKALAIAVIVVFTLVNFVGNRLMGRVESVIVAIKVAILVVFVVAAFLTVQDPGRLSPDRWSAPPDILFGAGILFVGYEGFGLIANAAGNMTNVGEELPRAVYWAVGLVIAIYVLVGLAVVANLPLAELDHLGDAALAQAAEPALGRVGFKLIAVAALLSTASAVNATLFGSTNVAYQIAKNGHLVQAFDRRLWGKDVEGLFLTAGLVVLFVLLFPLQSVAMMGSAAFLLVYTAVNLGHYRIRDRTGARGWIIVTSVVLCLTLFVVLSIYIVRHEPTAFIALVVALALSAAFEIAYRRIRGRTFRDLIAELG
jgi:amino acid transporter